MEILARPLSQEDRTGPEMWVDEAIWGHRLHDEQSPWLTLLEFLGVLHAEAGQLRALAEPQLNELGRSWHYPQLAEQIGVHRHLGPLHIDRPERLISPCG